MSGERPILIVGLGSAGRRHLANLRFLGHSEFIFLRSNQGTISDSLHDGLVTSDVEQALGYAPSMAIISNPTSLHLPVSVAAARAGCHLFIEKPLAHNLEGVRELQTVTKERGLTTMIGCQFRFHPLMMRLSAQVRSGRIGNVVSARAEWGEYLPDWHSWEDHRQSYSAREDLGGGSILTLIHPLDYLYWLFGEVLQARASARSIAALQTETHDDLAEITIEFASGVIGQIHLDYIQRPPVHKLQLLGDNGRVEWDYYAGTLHWESVLGEVEIEKVPEGFERNTMFLDEMRHFLKCVEQHTPTCIPLEDGIAVLDIALRAKDSYAERASV
ncbi:MAG: gfo/Idh/MocA family oxidoreductase [Acidobacteria bacterium]|nr:gfo/Idh/MocA family oxidoreductase [Acidobacteriota bacterium]